MGLLQLRPRPSNGWGHFLMLSVAAQSRKFGGNLGGNDSGACSTMSISRLPPRTFRPFASGGLTIGVARLATPSEKQRVRQQMLARNWHDDAISSELGSFCQKSHLIAGLIDLS
jgi:hypothetical protein